MPRETLAGLREQLEQAERAHREDLDRLEQQLNLEQRENAKLVTTLDAIRAILDQVR